MNHDGIFWVGCEDTDRPTFLFINMSHTPISDNEVVIFTDLTYEEAHALVLSMSGILLREMQHYEKYVVVHHES